MDPDANLQEQERILAAGARGPANRIRLHDLREALWTWLRRRGYEPRWSECPKAARHFKSYGGSNVVAALMLCVLLPVSAAAQVRTVYTNRDPATGALLQRPVAVQRDALVRVPSPQVLAGLKAREFVAPPEWPDGPYAYVVPHPGYDWPLPPGTQARARRDMRRPLAPPYVVSPYGYRGLPLYGRLHDFTYRTKGARSGGQ